MYYVIVEEPTGLVLLGYFSLVPIEDVYEKLLLCDRLAWIESYRSYNPDLMSETISLRDQFALSRLRAFQKGEIAMAIYRLDPQETKAERIKSTKPNTGALDSVVFLKLLRALGSRSEIA